MNTRAYSIQVWRQVLQYIGPGGTTIPKAMALPHPRDAGARSTISWPVGQLADYALDLEMGAAPLLIREFADRFEVVIAEVRLADRTLALVESNPMAALCLGSALLGAAVGTAVMRKADGALLGAGMGVLVAVLIDAYSRHRSVPTNS